MNPQSLASHQRWSDKFGFPFPVCADEGGAVCRQYRVLDDDGRLKRTVYAVDKSGTVVFAARGAPSDDEILAALEGAA